MTAVTMLHEQKLVYVQTPKVASTSLIAATYRIAGVGYEGNKPRKIAQKRSFQEKLNKIGYVTEQFPPGNLEELRRKYDDYFWFCVKREPVKRLVSSYHNKIHRYAQLADRKAYFKGTLGKFSEGLKGIDNSRYLAMHVAKFISFEKMVDGLMNTGLDFDNHFKLQHKILNTDNVHYDMQLRQERLAEDFTKMCNQAGLGSENYLGSQRLNESKLPALQKVELSDDIKRKIVHLYSSDFAKLGYPKPL
ncbi:MAG: hypothetical protein COB40_13055 [Marinosulfonomonas sp.]|nr:MAG: hypothetical protein COB40_13055 [Marinosulfonomonas sp.]